VAAFAMLLLSFPLPARGVEAPDPGGNSGDLSTPAQLGKRLGFSSNLGGFASNVPAKNEVELIRLAGGSVKRFPVSWQAVQPNPGPYNNYGPVSHTSNFLPDREYLATIQAGMTPVVFVLDAPAWAAASPSGSSCGFLGLSCLVNGGQQRPHQPPAPARILDYAWFVAWVSLRYPQAVVETWNEPNESYYWGSRYPDPSLMAKMQCAAYDLVKFFNPTQRVMTPGIGAALADTSTRLSYATYTRIMYQTTGRICWDMMNVHLYFGSDFEGPGTVLARQMQAIRTTKATFGDTKPIWVTETGVSTSLGAASAAQQTSHHIRGVHKLLTIPDLAVVLVHSLRDGPTLASHNKANTVEYGFGMLAQDLRAKPQYCHWVKLHGNSYWFNCP